MTRKMLSDTGRLETLLLRVVDGGLAGCIFFVPFLLSGRLALGQLILVVLAVTVAMAWTLRQCLRAEAVWRRSAAEWLLLAAVSLLVVQLVPLPRGLLELLAPHTSEILPLWSSGGESAARLGVWSCVSLAPAATQSALVLLLAYGMLLLVTVQRIQSTEDVERLVRWCAMSALLMAGFGLVQFFLGNGKFFWFYEHPYSTTSDAAKGSFANRNHFAHFLALGVGPLLWWIQDARRRSRPRPAGRFRHAAGNFESRALDSSIRWLALGVVLFAGLLSLSRGGVAVMILATAVCAVVCYRAGSLRGRFLLGLGAVAVLIGVSLTIVGYERTTGRMDDLASGSLETLDQGGRRRTIWTAVAKATSDYALVGSGGGTHRYVYPMYLEPSREAGYLENSGRIYYTHAESGPLQVALENGAVGLALLMAGIALVGFWCVAALRNCTKDPRENNLSKHSSCRRRLPSPTEASLPSPTEVPSTANRRQESPPTVTDKSASSRRLLVLAGAISASLLASVVHSLVDFVWYVPACTAMLAVLVGCACRVYQLSTCRRRLPSPTEASLPSPTEVPSIANRRRESPPTMPRRFATVATAVVLLVGTWMIGNRTGPVLAQSHWHRYRIMARAALDREPYDTQQGDPAAAEASGRASRRALETMISELEQVVRHCPDRADARFELARSYLLLFEYTQEESVNVMPLPMIREAAIHAHFPSREALDAWLARSVGGHCKYLDLALRHTRRGLALCPLEGVGYLYLAELCFLEGRDPATAKPAYVAQALKVRPFDGTILMAAGNEAVLAGDFEQAVDYWRRSYRCGRVHQRQLLARLAGRARPEHLHDEIAFFLNTFEPDLAMLRRMDQVYGRIARSEQLVELRRRHAEAAAAEAKRLKGESAGGESAGVVWLEARLQYVKLGDHARAVQCLRNALACDPNSYKVHYRLAIGLADQQQYTEAEKHLQWCLARRPGDPQLQGKLREIMRRRLECPVLTATGKQSGELR